MGLPFVWAPTGSMGNNGAITLGTALDRTYSKCYMLFPAGAIASGVPAATAWYYVEMSSTTAGVAYNLVYTSGNPVIPGVNGAAAKVAFATTGPGAFTGVTTKTNGPNFSLPANVMLNTGQLYSEQWWAANTAAGNKTFETDFGGSTAASPVASTQSFMDVTVKVANMGQTNAQIATMRATTSAGGVTEGGTFLAIDTTAAQTFTTAGTNATATNYIILEQLSVLSISNGL
jgi:hypothetical protein